ncbi:MAG: CYTH domain-containing protein [Planctomycetota bacterium]
MEEIERSWCAVGGEGVAAWEEMRNRPSLGANGIRVGAERTFLDRIYDSGSGELGRRGITLRARTWEGGGSITVKGRSHRDVNGTLTRQEWEEPASAAAALVALTRVHDLGGPQALAAGIGTREARGFGERWDPTDFFALFGLHEAHIRLTDRLARPVIDEAGAALAELAVDLVRYPFPDVVVCHLEVELELAPGADRRTFDGAAAEIDRARSLRPWPHSKTALGKALARLAERGGLADLLVDGHRLSPEAYDRLDDDLG